MFSPLKIDQTFSLAGSVPVSFQNLVKAETEIVKIAQKKAKKKVTEKRKVNPPVKRTRAKKGSKKGAVVDEKPEIPEILNGKDEEKDVKLRCKDCGTLANKDHVCNQYTENHTLINDPKIENPDPTSSGLQCDSHPVFNVLTKKSEKITGVLEMFNKTSNITELCEWSCIFCSLKFHGEPGWVRHIENVHLSELYPENQDKKSMRYMRVHRCMCGQVFNEEKPALDHVLKFHLNDLAPDKEEPSSSHTVIGDSQTLEAEELKQIGKLKIEEIIQSMFLHQVLQCEMCDALFSDSKSLLQHTSQHNPIEGFICSTCDLKCLDLKSLHYHRRSECLNLRRLKKLLLLSKSWICNICSSDYQEHEKLIEHRYKEFHFYPRINWDENELLFLCEFCLKCFQFADALIDHYNLNHKNDLADLEKSPEEIQAEPVKASIKSSNKCSFTSTKYRQYLCEVCGKSYTQSSHLWQHLRFHQGVKPFKCNVEGCDRKFTIRPDLNDHIRKCHTGERPFKCTECDKSFLTGSVYYQHRLIHRGERRYGCDDCGRRFYRADALKNHQRIHTGEKPFQCLYCNKSFRQRGDRDKHIKARHPELPGINPIRQAPMFGKGRTKGDKVERVTKLRKKTKKPESEPPPIKMEPEFEAS